ncbi:MAG: hypothetical protein E7339_07530 [Clostridiales bacterium]|nr:hypothetical protein [Clostridiales bacterium]
MKKSFKYKLTPTLWALFIIGLILAAYCIYSNIVRFLELLKLPDVTSYSYIGSLLCVLIGVAAFLFIPPAMLASKYVIADKQLLLCWGLVKNKYDINDITTATHFRASNKLALTFTDESFIAVNIDPEEFDQFVEILKQVNPKIFYSLNVEDKKIK